MRGATAARYARRSSGGGVLALAPIVFVGAILWVMAMFLWLVLRLLLLVVFAWPYWFIKSFLEARKTT